MSQSQEEIIEDLNQQAPIQPQSSQKYSNLQDEQNYEHFQQKLQQFQNRNQNQEQNNEQNDKNELKIQNIQQFHANSSHQYPENFNQTQNYDQNQKQQNIQQQSLSRQDTPKENIIEQYNLSHKQQKNNENDQIQNQNNNQQNKQIYNTNNIQDLSYPQQKQQHSLDNLDKLYMQNHNIIDQQQQQEQNQISQQQYSNKSQSQGSNNNFFQQQQLTQEQLLQLQIEEQQRQIQLTKLKIQQQHLLLKNSSEEQQKMHFFQKLIDIAQFQSPYKCQKLIELYEIVLSDAQTLELICQFVDKQRLIVDILNSFFTLMERFQGTHLEWNLKVLFNYMNEKLSKKEFYLDIINLIPKEGTRFTDNLQLNQEQQDLVKKLKELVQDYEVLKKNEAITTISLLLGKCQDFVEQFYIFCHVLTPIFKKLVEMPLKINHQIKLNLYHSLLDIIERYIFPSEYSIIIETNHLHGSQNYTLKNEKKYLQNHPQVYYSFATIMNQILLIPSQVLLQIRALQLIRRFYYYFPSLQEQLEGPIITVMSNIALYSKEVSQEKDPSIFLYKLLQNQQNLTESFKEKLETNPHIQKLKANKYYSVKALSYPDDIDIVYKTNNLNLQIMFPFYKKIEAGSFYHYNCIITKPNSLLYWNFKTIDFDIQFGLYKIESLQLMTIQDYPNAEQNKEKKDEKNQKTKTIIPLQRSNSYQQSVTGFMLIKLPGYYRIIFDNTYSFWRAKELFFSIHVLEP